MVVIVTPEPLSFDDSGVLVDEGEFDFI